MAHDTCQDILLEQTEKNVACTCSQFAISLDMSERDVYLCVCLKEEYFAFPISSRINGERVVTQC